MHWLQCSSASLQHLPGRTSRFGHTAVTVDSQDVWGSELVIVFGGVTNAISSIAADPHTALNDVIVFQADSEAWLEPDIATSSRPDARAFHCAAAVDRKIYIYGGHVLAHDHDQNKKRRHFFGDVWCLDTDTWEWRCVWAGPAHEGPGKRDMASLTHVGGNHLLMFGGRNEGGRAVGDAWIFDVQRCMWSPLRAPAPSPAPRKMHSIAHVGGGRVILFGGERDTGVLDDLWSLKGLDGSEQLRWTQIKLRPGPSGRFGHSLTAGSGWLALFGGCRDHSSFLSLSRNYVQCRELWVLDLPSFSWMRLDADAPKTPELAAGAGATAGSVPAAALGTPYVALQPGPAPAERMCHTMTSLSGGRLLLLGGRRKEGICDDSWWLGGVGERQAASGAAAAVSAAGSVPVDASGAMIRGSDVSSKDGGPAGWQRQVLLAGAQPGHAAASGPAAGLPGAPAPIPPGMSPSSSTSSLLQTLFNPLKPLSNVTSAARGALEAVQQRAVEAGGAAAGMLTQVGMSLGGVGGQLAVPLPPPPLPPGQYMGHMSAGADARQALYTGQSMDAGAALAVQAAADAAALEHLRVTRLGLPATPPSHIGQAVLSPTPEAAPQIPQAVQATVQDVGRRVQMASGTTWDGSTADGVKAVHAGRVHLSSIPQDAMTVGQLELIARDLPLLQQQQRQQQWEQQLQHQKERSATVAGARGRFGSSEEEVGLLLSCLMACSSPYAIASQHGQAGCVEVEALHMRDVPGMLAEYARLVREAQQQQQQQQPLQQQPPQEQQLYAQEAYASA